MNKALICGTCGLHLIILFKGIVTILWLYIGMRVMRAIEKLASAISDHFKNKP